MKLRSHLIALVVAALLPLLIFSTIVVGLLAQRERTAMDRALRETTRALAFAVDNALDNSITTLDALATSSLVDAGDIAAFYRECARALPSQAGWFTIVLLDPAGRQLFSVQRPYGEELPAVGQGAYFRQVIASGRPAISDLLVGEFSPDGSVFVAVPVKRAGSIRYVLVAGLEPGHFRKVLTNESMPREWTSALIDRQGSILARSRAAPPFERAQAPPPLVARLHEVHEGSARDATPSGAALHTTFSRLPLTGWTVALSLPAAVIDGGFRRFLTAVIGGGLVFLLAGSVLAALLGRRLAAPIRSLSTAAEGIGRGDDAAPRASGVHEVEALGRALETAASRRREAEGERGQLLAREQVAREEAVSAQQRASFLAEASRVLASTLDYESTLQTVAGLAVPHLADLCLIDLVDDDGSIRRVAGAHVDPEKEAAVRELRQRFPPDADGPHPVAKALRSGRPELAPEISGALLSDIVRDPDHRKIAETLDYRSYLVVPLMARGRTIGAISLIAGASGRRYDAADIPFAEDLARRAAVAVDNARLFRESERRRRAAEALASVGRFLSQTLDPDIVAQRIADSVRTLLGLQSSIFYRLDAEAESLSVVASSGELGTVFERDFTIPQDAGATGLAVQERRAVTTPNVLTDPRITLTPELRARLEASTHRSALALPLMVQSRVVGVLGLGDRENRVFTEEEILLGQAIADQAALALENARLYAEARESNRAKDDFLATLSHELRTPLTAMLGWIRMLRSGHLDAPTAARALEVIDRNTKLQAQLIEDLLDVSRIITGKLDLDFRSVDLVGVIEAAIDAVGQGADAKSIRLAKTFDRTAGVVSGDPARLQQVVWNLLSNAIKFTPKGGRVDVRLDRAASYVRIRVIDTGKGISAEFLPHIFGRFRQADSTTTRAHGGLGLGLAIVHHLVELHHGTVQAESAGEDEGATFTVMLPLLTLREAGDVASRRRAGGSAAMAPPRLDGARVLVVDDEPDTREVLTTILGGSGAEVTSVGSTGDALDALARARPDVLVSDIAMPDEDGYALIRQVRALEADGGGRIPAVALTAHARSEDRTQVMTAGYQVHLPKPVEPSTLVEAVARLLGRR